MHQSVGGRGPGECLDARLQPAGVAHEHAADLPLVKLVSVDGDGGLEQLALACLANAGRHVRQSAHALLAVLGSTQHPHVETDPGHHAECLAIASSGVDDASLVAGDHPHDVVDVGGQFQPRREQVGGAAGHYCERGRCTHQRLGGGAYGAVATTDDDYVGTVLAGLGGGGLAIGTVLDLQPLHVGETRRTE